MSPTDASIRRVEARTYRVATETPEADGTLEWDSTTVVLVELSAGGQTGLGYTYGSAAAKEIISDTLRPVLMEQDALAVPRLWAAMIRAVRNIGWRGVCAHAISAVDVALWDLKARLLQTPLATLFGVVHSAVPIYGSGGFTNYSDHRLADQLAGWVKAGGCRAVKMKIGRDPQRDPARMRAARDAIGDAGLMIDANGALSRRSALALADEAAALDTIWFEEPVSSDDLEGLRLLRDRGPPGLEIAAGEYGYEHFYFRRMLEAGAVDVLQADATRCCGYTGFQKAIALCESWSVPISAHTAPALHLPLCCSTNVLRHVEWFHDHVRIERMFFDGAPVPADGTIAPDLSRPGHGLTLKRADVERFAA
jgi:L-alanine-DL-glutamate epimerase-like enolase superfamily enzyme